MQYLDEAPTFDSRLGPKTFIGWIREMVEQVWNISNELYNDSEDTLPSIVVDDSIWPLRKIEKLLSELRELQQDKTDRLNHVLDLLNTVSSLCKVLGIDFSKMN